MKVNLIRSLVMTFEFKWNKWKILPGKSECSCIR